MNRRGGFPKKINIVLGSHPQEPEGNEAADDLAR